MIKISQGEFGEKVREVIRGEKTLISLCKELETDERTLIQNIILHSTYDPEIYAEFVEKHPYKTREREDIDFEALAIETLKHRMNTVDAAAKYNVSVRTIQRKVEKFKQTNPQLYRVYKEAKQANKCDQPYAFELREQIEALVQRPVIIGEINGQTEKRLEEIERIYNERRPNYPTKEATAQSMGITPNRLYKLLNQLYRIKIEKVQRQENEFKKNLVVDTKSTNQSVSNSTKSKETIREGEEK